MTPRERSELALTHARATLRLRDDAKRYLTEAEAAGKKREASQWKKQIAKVEKLIVSYGLERYAHRT